MGQLLWETVRWPLSETQSSWDPAALLLTWRLSCPQTLVWAFWITRSGQTTGPAPASISWWRLNQMCCFHMMEYYVAGERNEEMATPYSLGEPAKQADGKQLVVDDTIPFLRTSRMGKSTGTESGLAVAQGRGLGGFWDFLRWWEQIRLSVVLGAHIRNCTKNHRAEHCKWVIRTVCELYLNEDLRKKKKQHTRLQAHHQENGQINKCGLHSVGKSWVVTFSE